MLRVRTPRDPSVETWSESSKDVRVRELTTAEIRTYLASDGLKVYLLAGAPS
jgi:hypothetical protein